MRAKKSHLREWKFEPSSQRRRRKGSSSKFVHIPGGSSLATTCCYPQSLEPWSIKSTWACAGKIALYCPLVPESPTFPEAKNYKVSSSLPLVTSCCQPSQELNIAQSSTHRLGNSQAIFSIMQLRNGNGPTSNGNRMCVAWLNELTSPEGVNLLSKLANDHIRALGPITTWWPVGRSQGRMTIRGTSSEGIQEVTDARTGSIKQHRGRNDNGTGTIKYRRQKPGILCVVILEKLV